MHKFCTVMLALFVSLSTFAEGSIKGKVVDAQTGEALMFVAVQLLPGNGTSTNEKGEFIFQNLPNGTYELQVSHLSYEKFSMQSIQITDNLPDIDLKAIKLKQRSTVFPAFEVSGEGGNITFGTAGTTNRISKMSILQAQPVGSEEMLKTVAGVHIAGDMGISNRLNVGIRGSYPRRSDKILILEDGAPIAPAPYLSPSAYYNPPTERLDGIEVIKGAEIMTYGPNTMYGAINYITRRPPSDPGFGVQLTGGQGNYNSQYVTYGGTWNNIGAELQVLKKHFDGYQDNTQSDIFNATTKVYGDLGEKSTVYLKLNYHQEKSKATYSGQTPLTFNLDPRQNPFDADDLLTSRYAIDLGYNYKAGERLILKTKVYTHQFRRDWWRQNTTLIKASDVSNYVGESIFADRYGYLEGHTFGDDDYVRVGKISNGQESTKARNRIFRVAGVREVLEYSYMTGEAMHKLELGATLHVEQFYNQEIKSDSSRFSRSGNLIVDQKYLLEATSAFLRHKSEFGKLTVTPMARFEWIRMRKFNLLNIANDPMNDGSKNYGALENRFNTFLPGIAFNYALKDTGNSRFELTASAYKGYTPPTTSAGFIGVDEGGDVNTSPEEDAINMQAETSTSVEGGFRGTFANNLLETQVIGFNNNISNFYSAGRKEAFETLGSVNIMGLEVGANLDLSKLLKMKETHCLNLNVSYTYLNAMITSGRLKDSDLMNAKHTDASKAELIDKINAESAGFNVYFAGDSLVDREFTTADFDNIESVEMIFGDGGIASNHAPYTPDHIITIGLNYRIKGFSIGGSFHQVGEQYTDYLNFNSETAEGAIGKLSAYQTIDMNLGYTFKSKKSKLVNGMQLFVVGKNLTDQRYVASRLHRVSSGIMPAGFRQVNGGLRFTL